jgi:hypothetical protein
MARAANSSSAFFEGIVKGQCLLIIEDDHEIIVIVHELAPPNTILRMRSLLSKKWKPFLPHAINAHGACTGIRRQYLSVRHPPRSHHVSLLAIEIARAAAHLLDLLGRYAGIELVGALEGLVEQRTRAEHTVIG